MMWLVSIFHHSKQCFDLIFVKILYSGINKGLFIVNKTKGGKILLEQSSIHFKCIFHEYLQCISLILHSLYKAQDKHLIQIQQ